MKSELTPFNRNLKNCINLAFLEGQGAGYDGVQNLLSYRRADLMS